MQNIILLAEDDQNDMFLTERALRKASISDKLVVVRDGASALNYLLHKGPFTGYDTGCTPALVLLDLNLPRMSGLEVLRQIRANPATALVPVVVFTSSLDERDLRDAYCLGANSFIRKPVDFSQFVEVIRNLGFFWLTLNQRPPEYKPVKVKV